jgi:hypothetical protein
MTTEETRMKAEYVKKLEEQVETALGLLDEARAQSAEWERRYKELHALFNTVVSVSNKEREKANA